MASPPPLLRVSVALSAQVLPHILDLITSFLLPRTIDSAVYNRLDRVIPLYQDTLPYTVRAMDGAAAKGHLDVVQFLHSNRTEGCSNTAFINATVNNHLHVLEWLYQFYPQNANPAQEIVKAAECGNIQILIFLQFKVRREEVEPALEAAATHGHVEVLTALLNRPYSMRRSFLAAADNGQTQVVQFLLNRGCNERYSYVNPALMKAAEGGHCEVIALLIDKSDAYTIGDALIEAAAHGREVVATLLVKWCKSDKLTVARALEKAAENFHCDVVKLLLENIKHSDDTKSEKWQVNAIIDLAFMSAVEKGDALVIAGSNYRLDVLEYIIDYCEARNLKSSSYRGSITTIAELAAGKRHLNMAKVIVSKCDTLSTGEALRIAVDNDDVEMLRLFLMKSSRVSIQDAVVNAARTNRVEMLEILLEHSSADAIEQTLILVDAVATPAMTEMLLGRCDPGAYCRIFANAAGHGLVGLVQLLRDKMDRHSIRCALISAAISGHTEVVKGLMDKSDSTGITCAFEMAALKGKVDVVE
ncbi:Hypothetical protein PHPALM_17206, partial [Phytophthora palmivora]